MLRTPQDTAIRKAAALVEAHQYIQRFRDKIVVVKVGGSVQDDEVKLRALLTDVAFMSGVGMRPVIVHGGGKSITRAMKDSGLEARFVQGRRYTDRATLEIAERVLVEEINRGLVDQLNASGSRAVGLHSRGSCVIFAEKIKLKEPVTGEDLDLGYVGQVAEVNTVLLNALCEDGFVPVIAPIALALPGADNGFWKFNVNADTAAARVAAALGAAKLVMCSDTHGIRTGQSDESLASHLTKQQIEDLAADGVIGAGMLPKVEAAFTALTGGVDKVHIIDGRIPHSLLLEIFSATGIGTEIVLK